MATYTTKRDSTAAIELWEQGLMLKREVLSHPILPKQGCENVLITSALPYVNNVPHMGNIIGCVLSADCYARYSRLRGHRVLFICGTDEYGTATEAKALQEGLTPQAICDKYNAIHTNVYQWFNISFDYFGRTTTEQQTKIAQDIFFKLYKNGNLLEDTVNQLYCNHCQRFLADRFVEGTCPNCNYNDARGDQCDSCGKLINAIDLMRPRCKVCGRNPETKSSMHLFLDLPKIEPKLRDFIQKAQKQGSWSNNAIAITAAWLKEGIKPRCITRDLKWGTPVPLKGYEDKVFYVWFDAPIGYLSITANYTEHWEQWWKNPSEIRLVNFMAKDNVPFHTVVFPCSLIGTGDNYTLLSDISSTEYLHYENDKFSKSRGVGVFGDNVIESGISADVYRLYLLGNRPETQDTAFIWDDVISKNNNEVINNLGNFVFRSLSLLFKCFNGEIQPVVLTDSEIELLTTVSSSLTQYNEAMSSYRLRDGLSIVFEISKAGNQYIQVNKPWELKVGERLGTVLSLSSQLVAIISVLLHPFAPESSEKIMEEINLPHDQRVIPDAFVPLLPVKTKVVKPSIIFGKIETSLGHALRSKYSAGAKASSEQDYDEILSRLRSQLLGEYKKCSKSEIQRLAEEQRAHIESLLLKKGTCSKKLFSEYGKLHVLRAALDNNKS